MMDEREVIGGMRLAALAFVVTILVVLGALAWIVGTLLSVLTR